MSAGVLGVSLGGQIANVIDRAAPGGAWIWKQTGSYSMTDVRCHPRDPFLEILTLVPGKGLGRYRPECWSAYEAEARGFDVRQNTAAESP